MGLKERLQEVADSLGSQTALAKVAGVSKGRVSQWLQGEVSELMAEIALNIEEKTKFSARWLVFGKLPKLNTPGALTHKKSAKNENTDIDERLLAVIRTWQETDEAGKRAIWAGRKAAMRRNAHKQRSKAQSDTT